MRSLALEVLIARCGDVPTEDAIRPIVASIMDKFLTARSKVGVHTYEDALVCVQWLKDQGLQVGVLTNGNALLDRDPHLSPLLDLCLTAGEIGAMKPSLVGFVAMCQRLDVPAKRVLVVGDSVEKDALAAQLCGMTGVHLKRTLEGEGDEQNRNPYTPPPRPSPSSSSSSSSTGDGTLSREDASRPWSSHSDRGVPNIVVTSLHAPELQAAVSDYIARRRVEGDSRKSVEKN